MDGWVVLDRLKHDPSTRHIPVHVISVDESWQRGVKLGAFAFLQKPVEPASRWTTPSPSLEELPRAAGQERSWSSRTTRSSARNIVDAIGDGDVRDHRRRHRRPRRWRPCRPQPFDCMVLDLGLPDMPGLELIERSRRTSPRTTCRVIVYTGRDLTPEEQAQLDVLAETIIIKDVRSLERLLDETALFLHRVEADLRPATRQMLQQGQQVGPGARRQEGPDRRRRHAQHLRPDQHAGALGDGGAPGRERPAGPGPPRSDARTSTGADGHHDAGDGRLRDDAGDPRADRSSATLPIIALTAKAMKDDRQKCLEAGASDYIAKPVGSEQLLSMLRVWLHRTRIRPTTPGAGGRLSEPSHARWSRDGQIARGTGRPDVLARIGEGMEPEPKVNILLVDDQPNNLLALEAILGGMGLNLVRARSGEEALLRVLDDDFAVILMDVQMPGMDGFETADLIRERDRSQHTPIIFLTAFQSTDGQIFQGYSARGGRLPVQADRPDGAAVEGRGLRRAVPEDRAGEAAGGPAASRASGGSTSASSPRRSGAGSSSGSARRRPGRGRPPRRWRRRRRS